jgi:hypothetical protein
MSSNLMLRYEIKLVTNMDREAKRAAKAIADAQKQSEEAIEKTSRSVGRLETALLSMGRVATWGSRRQAEYLASMSRGYLSLERAATAAASAMKKAAQAAPQVAAGTVAAGWVAQNMTKRPMDYSTRLAHMSNTAFSDRDVAGRISGKNVLAMAIKEAVRQGGGSRDEAADALDSMIARGVMTPAQAMAALPRVMKASTGSGATGVDLAGIGMSGVTGFRIKPEDVPEMLNIAMAGGQAGGFELKDMARHLPELMAQGSKAGMGGLEDFRRIVASLQASVTTAGSKDQAGNNMVNLLDKVHSMETSRDLDKLGIGLTDRLVAQKGKGVNAIDAFVGIVDEVASRDKDYLAAKRKLGNAGTDAEKKDSAEAMVQLLQGKAVGSVIQDRQAMAALVAELNQREYVKKVMDKTRTDTNAIDTAYEVVNSEVGTSMQRLGNEAKAAQDDVFNRIAPALKGLVDGAVDVAKEYPTATAAVTALAGAASLAAAALGAAGLAGMIRPGGVAPVPGGVPPTAGPSGAPAAGAGAGGARAMIERMGGGRAAALRGGIYGASAYALYKIYDAFGQLDDAKKQAFEAQGGSFLSLDSRIRLDRQRMPLPPGPGVPGQPDLLGVPGMGGLSLGQGKLDVAVRVTDDRVTATTQVTQPMAGVKINPGNTNPGSYK